MTYRICPRCFEKYQTKAGWIDRTEPVGTETRDIRVRGKPSPEGKQRFYNETIKLEIRACVCGGQMYNDGLSPGDQHFLDMTK